MGLVGRGNGNEGARQQGHEGQLGHKGQFSIMSFERKRTMLVLLDEEVVMNEGKKKTKT